jgi:hypothetical protein
VVSRVARRGGGRSIAGHARRPTPVVAGEWLIEKLGTGRRRSWQKRPLGVDADIGQIVAAAQRWTKPPKVGPLLDQITGPLASITADGAYNQDGVNAEIADRHPDAAG